MGYGLFDILNIISYSSHIDKVNTLNQSYSEINSIETCPWNTFYNIKKYRPFEYVDLEHILKTIY